MKIKKLAATSAMLITALGLATGTSHADPVTTTPAPVNVSYEAQDESLTLSTDIGSLNVADGVLEIKSTDGTVVAGAPLRVRVDEFVFPVAAEITGRTATLTPRLDREHAVYQPVALPFEDKAEFKNEYEREKAAWSRMTGRIGFAATLSGLTTTVLGGIVGCAVGAVATTIATAPILAGLGSGPIIGCLLGAAAGASLIGIAGTILITAPVAVASIIDYFTTINSPLPPRPAE
ncbi:hypothetical protein HLB23_06710 [Nocardia uniformis]|uniref:DUF8020 domain-containing protein n=1 Tax=Nocardia uniformis TaxID=53432 RepID=A0A849C9D4_9NOCA|nr:hypothetical protein [Nocardia uniformis]NNH69561.1 hypothetical protein [Nocardia uniformis]